jgi:hypothetical protein
MTGRRILEIIAMTPNCRESHIYNGVHVDEHETHALIASLEAVGDVIASTREDGVTFYKLSGKFKASDAYKRIAMQVEVESRIVPGLPRVERAIEYVRAKGVATSSELHQVMELERDELASRYLADALQDGRLIKDGKYWTIGAGQQAAEPKAAPALSVPQFVPPQSENVFPIAPRTARAKIPTKLDFSGFADMLNRRMDGATEITATTSGTAPKIRCGLWSDGSVEVQRDGKTTALLFVEEMVCLADFWSRVSTKVKEA